MNASTKADRHWSKTCFPLVKSNIDYDAIAAWWYVADEVQRLKEIAHTLVHGECAHFVRSQVQGYNKRLHAANIYQCH